MTAASSMLATIQSFPPQLAEANLSRATGATARRRARASVGAQRSVRPPATLVPHV